MNRYVLSQDPNNTKSETRMKQECFLESCKVRGPRMSIRGSEACKMSHGISVTHSQSLDARKLHLFNAQNSPMGVKQKAQLFQSKRLIRPKGTATQPESTQATGGQGESNNQESQRGLTLRESEKVQKTSILHRK